MADDGPKRASRRMHPRNRHRDLADESAHAAGADQAETAVPSHPFIAQGRAAVITAAEPLTEFVAHVRQMGAVAYDSEFIGELSYHPRLCLVQLATTQQVALVDPLAGLDLRPLWDLIADASVEKIVHAGAQDLEPVFRLIGRRAANIFDTQIAAGFASLSYPTALGKLLRELLGVHLGKGFTFTHWDRRPLTGVQLRYAADDVRFLPALRESLRLRLEGNGHARWAAEESESLCDPNLYEFDPSTDYRRIRGAGSLSAGGLGVLRELMRWRDQAARENDLPPRSFLRDEILLDMCRRPIRAVEDLARVKGLPRPVENRHGREILAATQAGLASPVENSPSARSGEESPADRFHIDSLWSVLQVWCAGRGIDPSIVTSRQDMAQFYRMLADETASEHRLLKGWRREAVGQLLLDLLAGKRNLQVTWRDGALRAE